MSIRIERLRKNGISDTDHYETFLLAIMNNIYARGLLLGFTANECSIMYIQMEAYLREAITKVCHVCAKEQLTGTKLTVAVHRCNKTIQNDVNLESIIKSLPAIVEYCNKQRNVASKFEAWFNRSDYPKQRTADAHKSMMIMLELIGYGLRYAWTVVTSNKSNAFFDDIEFEPTPAIHELYLKFVQYITTADLVNPLPSLDELQAAKYMSMTPEQREDVSLKNIGFG
jgi:hypothetical protein